MLDWYKLVYNSPNTRTLNLVEAENPAFVRIKVPKETIGTHEAGAASIPLLGSTSRKHIGEHASPPQKAPAKPPRNTRMRSKKRKMDDMLSSFT
jgi:hypothetical protein